MREIKFRFWHKTKKRMSRVLGLGVIWEYLCEEWGLFDWKDIEKLQYTGLHDKNGVEIYEGDALQRWEEEEGYNDIGQVEWFGSMFMVLFWDGDRISLDEYAADTGEVIGNIYSNPELLEGA